ncbi:MAG: hypothetical protein ACRDOE_22275 [Streptosporangiaceae bacterium]
MEKPTVVAASIDCAAFNLLYAEVLRREELPAAGQVHLAQCAGCRAMLEDFEAIAARVRQASLAGVEPVPNFWPQIRERLLQEGVIHASASECEAAPAAVPPPGMPKLVRRPGAQNS